jgi:hypothetical protein
MRIPRHNGIPPVRIAVETLISFLFCHADAFMPSGFMISLQTLAYLANQIAERLFMHH